MDGGAAYIYGGEGVSSYDCWCFKGWIYVRGAGRRIGPNVHTCPYQSLEGCIKFAITSHAMPFVTEAL